jgi:hypothetical protein
VEEVDSIVGRGVRIHVSPRRTHSPVPARANDSDPSGFR